LQTGAGTHLPSCNTSVGLQTGAGTHLPSCNTSVGLQVIGPTKGVVTIGGVTIAGLGGGGPGGVVVVVEGLGNVLGGGGGDDVVPPELTSGLLGAGPPPLGKGLLLLPDDVSAYTIPVAAEALTMNATIIRNRPTLSENSVFFMILTSHSLPVSTTLSFVLARYLRKSN